MTIIRRSQFARSILKSGFMLVLAWPLLAGPAHAEEKTVRLLTVGNSFAENALAFLPEIAQSAGQRLVVGKANLGGWARTGSDPLISSGGHRSPGHPKP
jgi:hypothetical protein